MRLKKLEIIVILININIKIYMEEKYKNIII